MLLVVENCHRFILSSDEAPLPIPLQGGTRAAIQKKTNRKGEKTHGTKHSTGVGFDLAKGHLLMPSMGFPFSWKVKWGIAPPLPDLLPGLQL